MIYNNPLGVLGSEVRLLEGAAFGAQVLIRSHVQMLLLLMLLFLDVWPLRILDCVQNDPFSTSLLCDHNSSHDEVHAEATGLACGRSVLSRFGLLGRCPCERERSLLSTVDLCFFGKSQVTELYHL